jgi:feruloyl esterase
MSRTQFILRAAAVVALAALAQDRGPRAEAQAGPGCAGLAAARLPDVRITEAVPAAADPSLRVKVAHCRVSGVIETEIRFTALLPDEWNGRFFAGGGGGFGGAVENAAQTSANIGYATIGTDTGHQGDGTNASWALGRPDRVLNWGHRAVHRTAEVGKAIVKAYYGRDPQYSYFFGCSNGGRQALMEAQRYPADFDGIVACAPALDLTNIAAAFVRNTQVAFPDPRQLTASAVSPENLMLLESEVLEACDARDGVADGVLDDPRECRFDIGSLPACPDDRPSAECVTRSQRAAIARLFAPVTAGDEVVYPGQPFGGEGQPAGWRQWITGVVEPPADAPPGPPSLQYVFGTEGFMYLVFGRPDWDYSTYDLSRWRRDTAMLAPIVNADNPDLSAFKARRGKLILAHGWADPALNALATIAYYERVQAHDPSVRDYARLFLMPGVMHCAGGSGPDAVDWFAAIADWVEHGRTPDRLLAREVARDGRVLNTRPLCPYPERAVYDGSGNPTDAASFACRRTAVATGT